MLIAAVLSATIAVPAIAVDPQQAPDEATLQQILKELRELRDDRDAQKKEIEALRSQVEALTRELAAVRSEPAPAAAEQTPPEPPAPEMATAAPEPKPSEEQIATIDPYGSLRVVAGSDTEGNTAMRDNISRVGIKGSATLREGIDVVATAEVGINLWGRERTTIFGGDPGAPVGQVDNAVFARVGLLGVKGRAGQLTFGKQWSPYSDVAGMTDQAYVYGGDAGGVYAAGTDGGISGTGRADYATQYRFSNEHVSLGLQTQSRSKTDNDRSWADTYQAAFTWHAGGGFHVGAAYHEVRDGVVDPEPDESREGDRATVVAVSYDRPRLYLGATYMDMTNHERDDAGVFFSGRGLEIFARYHLTDRTAIEGVFNDLDPDESYAGGYRLRYLATTMSYRYAKGSVIYAGYKIEATRNADDSERDDVFGIGFNYTF
jgi:predicted porin/uncharacterized coiled-coil protein SlyX